MTLDDVFQPNQYGTVPIIDILGIGHISKYSDSVAKVIICGDSTYIPITTGCLYINEMDEKLGKIQIHHPEIDVYSTRVIHYKVADTSERLIVNAINQQAPLYYLTMEGSFHEIINKDKFRLLPNGTGWVEIAGNNIPVTFYYEDILYRLDLQGELK